HRARTGRWDEASSWVEPAWSHRVPHHTANLVHEEDARGTRSMKLVLAYKRVEGDLSTGDIRHEGLLGEEDIWASFEKAPWKTVLKTFARAIAAFPETQDVYVARTDRPGLVGL